MIGCSVAWNQIANVSTLWENNQWLSETITSNGNNKYTITFSGNETSRAWFIFDLANTFDCVSGNKYALMANLKITNGTISDAYTVSFQNGNTIIDQKEINISLKNGGIVPCGASGTVNRISLFTGAASSITSSTVIVLQLQLIDLTLAFGSSVADTLYAMTNNGGIDWLRNHNYPIDQYTQYGYGLYSTKPSAKKIYDENDNLLATYSLGSTELRGHLIVQNGEIVAEGDVRESNGEVQRNIKRIELNSLTYTYDSSNQRFISTTTISDVGGDSTGGYYKNIMCSKYVNKFANEDKVCFIYSDKTLYIYDYAYTDPTTFKNSLAGVYLEYPLATPTIETSSPFADPMSLNGCTTEEYVDDRTIPVPVGHETQYMGQSEDVVEIPSMPQSDGVWVQKCYVSGGKAQYVWELET